MARCFAIFHHFPGKDCRKSRRP